MKFACKINSPYIELNDEQYLTLEIVDDDMTYTTESLDNISILDIATTGDSWYNKMGFHPLEGNPKQNKIRNTKLNHAILSSIINDKDDYDNFNNAFRIDSDIDIDDSIKKVFTVIKNDYLKNKIKILNKEQFDIIQLLLDKYLMSYLIIRLCYIIFHDVI